MTAINAPVSRKVSVNDKAVISVCQINGDESFNVIPERVRIVGTVRTCKKALRERLVRELDQVATHTAPGSEIVPLHSPAFTIDERMLIKGVEMHCRFTLDAMQRAGN